MSVTLYYVQIVLVEDGGLHLLGVEAALLVPVVAGVELGEKSVSHHQAPL